MKFRKLRIAWSVVCGALCILLFAIWIQSYVSSVFVSKQLATGVLTLQSDRGDIGIWKTTIPIPQSPLLNATWDFGLSPIASSARFILDDDRELDVFGFRYNSTPFATVFYIPLWALLLPIATAGALAWIKWRLSWRNAYLAVCLFVTALSCGLWNRSYKCADITDRVSALNVCSMNGKLFVGETFMLTGRDALNPQSPVPDSHLGICTLSPDRFELIPIGGGVALPYWVILVVVTPLAAAPWLRWRFSLRTLLIATTLVAGVLGLVAWSMR